MQVEPPSNPNPPFDPSHDPREPDQPRLGNSNGRAQTKIDYAGIGRHLKPPETRQQPTWKSIFDKHKPKGKEPAKPSGSKGGGRGGDDGGDDNDDNDDDKEDEPTPRCKGKGTKIKEPDPFTDRKYIRQFMQQIVLNFPANPKHVKTDKSKILLCSSFVYMTYLGRTRAVG